MYEMRKVKLKYKPKRKPTKTRAELLKPLRPDESGVIVFYNNEYHLILGNGPIPKGAIIVAIWTGFMWLLLPDIDEIYQWCKQKFLLEHQREEALQVLKREEFHKTLKEHLVNYIKTIEEVVKERYLTLESNQEFCENEQVRMEEDVRNIMYELVLSKL